MATNESLVIKERQKTEKIFLEILAELDRSEKGYNVQYWKNRFSKMSNAEFIKLMEKWANNFEDNISYQLNSYNNEDKTKSPEPAEVIKYAKKRDIALKEYVIMPDDNRSNIDMPSVTRNKQPIFIVPVRKHQQTKDKKNSISSNNSKVNAMTNQLIDESKSAKLSDNEVFSLNATGQTNVIKELLGPRGDDPQAYAEMMKSINNKGSVRLKDLNMKTMNKQSIKTTVDFLRGAGLKIKL